MIYGYNSHRSIPNHGSELMAGACTKEQGSLLPQAGKALTVVGICQQCGAPIWGQPTLFPGEIPVIQRSCCCQFGSGMQSQVMKRST